MITPLVQLPHPNANIYAKLEQCNLFGSSKDRTVGKILEILAPPPGQLLIEATSGNTGIALAALARKHRCPCCIVMPENASPERQKLIRFHGGRIVLTSQQLGMAGSIEKAEEMAQKEFGIYVNQFKNPANSLAHYETTGPEIFAQCPEVDIFLAPVGTGGTIAGAGRFLREKKPSIRIIGIGPSQGENIPGIGANIRLPLLEDFPLDGWMEVSFRDALQAARNTCLGCGISAGAAIHVAQKLASLPENWGKTMVILLPDGIGRYLSIL